ncbi:MAG: ComEC/Rec2 family competence protein [Ginsengibacter sp.]
MAKAIHIYFWKRESFLRLVLCVISGILLQFYFGFNKETIFAAAAFSGFLFIIFRLLPESQRFKFPHLQGIFLSSLLVILAMFLTWNKDARHHTNWYGNYTNDSSFLVVTLKEPLVEKENSLKAVCNVESVINDNIVKMVKGKMILYLAKDSLSKSLLFGDRIIMKNKLQSIKNSGNPAAFNYEQYLAFQQIYFQAYLQKNDWNLLKEKEKYGLQNILYKSRDFVLKTLDQYIVGENESSLAKALLVGYRVDLDKDLVQAYSNAGVVHLIAISGLHLALIYALLLFVVMRIPFLKKNKVARLLVILICLWFFALLTGASASVLRAAVMFSFISIGSIFNKTSSVYNSMSVSAFLLLCFNPLLLFDVGFQLSYCAVFGIVLLYKYINAWFYFKNKILNYAWGLASVSIAAQVFTIPLCFYYFHQLPLLFLLANLIAIPLSTLALWGCITLLVLSPIPIIAVYVGKIITVLLWLMNHTVLLISDWSFTLWKNVSLSKSHTLLLYVIFIGFIFWLIRKNRIAFKISLLGSFLFAGLVTHRKWNLYQQKQMVVYNVPKHSAIDFFQRNNYFFVGEKNVSGKESFINFHLKPARISFFANYPTKDFSLLNSPNIFQFYDSRIIIIDTFIRYSPLSSKIKIDYLVLSKNSKVKIENINAVFDCKCIIADGTNALWKIDQWKKECKDLHLRFHSVSEQGAFVTNL